MFSEFSACCDAEAAAVYDSRMNEVPQCIGIILDGNRRWAADKGLPKLSGHRLGYQKVLDTARWVRDRGVGHLVVYAFSTENWNRDKDEVDYLMTLLLEMARQPLDQLSREGVRIRFAGIRSMLPAPLQEEMLRIEEGSAGNDGLTLWVCISYGSRAEIVEAARALAEQGLEITEQSLRARFWTAGMPDPDIIVRTSGEQRLSNFLLWQAAYSELIFIKPYWPDFDEQMLDGVLEEFSRRKRRHGR